MDIKNEFNLIGIEFNIDSYLKKYIHYFIYQTNDIWIRDYCPQSLKSGDFNITKYNAYQKKYPYKRDNAFSISYINSKSKVNKKLCKVFNNLIIEGGNTIFNKDLFLINKNPLLKHNDIKWSEIKKLLDQYFDSQIGYDYHVIDIKPIKGDDTNGHIDNLVRFYDNDTILYMNSTNKNHPDYNKLVTLENQLEKIIDKNNLSYKLIPIEHKIEDVIRSSNEILPFSYLNYIRNGKDVIFPINKKTTEEQKKEFNKIFMKDNLFFIDATSLLNQYGGLHCCTMNIVW